MANRRTFILASSLVAASALTSACSGSNTAGGTSSGGGQKATVVFWQFNTDEPTKTYWTKTIAAFESANPNITVDMQIVPWSDQTAKLTTAIATGKTPDVSMMGNDVVAQYVAQDRLVALDDYMAEWSKESGTDITKDFVPGDLLYYKINGHIYAAPLADETRCVWYNTDVFKKAGIDAASIKTWADMRTAAETIKSKVPGIVPWLAPMSKDYETVQTFMSVYLGYGARMLNDQGACGFDTPEFKDALTYWTNLYLDGLSTPDAVTYKGNDLAGLLMSGQGAMMIHGPSVTALVKGQAAEGKLGVIGIPAGPAGQFGFLGGWPLIVWKGQSEAAAAKFVHYATSGAPLKELLLVSGSLPPLKSMQNEAPWNTEPLATFAAGMNHAYPYQYPAQEIPQMGDIETETIQNAVQRVATKQATVEESTKQLVQEINSKLGK